MLPAEVDPLYSYPDEAWELESDGATVLEL